jgi:hypothetical protein
MKTIFKRTHTNLLIASMAASLGMHLAAQAQTADATVIVSGQITASTCVVNVNDIGGTSSGITSKNIALPQFSSSTAGTSTVATTFGAATAVMFTVGTNGTPGTTCVLNNSNSFWDLAIGLTSSQIQTITGGSLGTNTFLRNSVATGGTDAVVLLKGGKATTASATVNTASTALNLKGDAGVGGTLASGSAIPSALTSEAVVLSATWVRSAASAPSSGLFTQSIPLYVVYR